MSAIGAVAKTVSSLSVLAVTFYAGKFYGRHCESKDHRNSIAQFNMRASNDLEKFVVGLGEVSDEIKDEVAERVSKLKNRVKNNYTVQYIWGDITKDLEDLTEFVKNPGKDA